MACLDDLYAQIPTAEIARRLDAAESEVDSAVRTLVPVLVSGLHQGSQNPEHASKIESAASSHAARGLLDAGGGLDQHLAMAEQADGHQTVTTFFGGNDVDQVASALSNGGAGNSELLKKLLPIVLPIVLAYIGNQLSAGGAGEGAQQRTDAPPAGGLGEILGSILGGGDKSLGSILGAVLGGKGGTLGDILGGLLGGKN
ncbi:hypothetical protein MB901379_03357 [Mycobacterium basiliense]|uniref:DUF937 domain-containing protein n=1 Tax=Mycobacterium basiliense TaxID=2094119 RepID=A0A447GH07_9MYCO|nr:DUF937 domain-containing protein [Mycobacterium basiliense]VDM89776.1 hypothetical protein MB901379_03357 [Mycobacterium basiliense]